MQISVVKSLKVQSVTNVAKRGEALIRACYDMTEQAIHDLGPLGIHGEPTCAGGSHQRSE